MKYFAVLALISAAAAAKLENVYLPPNARASSGASAGLQAPFGSSGSAAQASASYSGAASASANAEILKYDNEINEDGYHYAYETSDGTKAEQQGRFKEIYLYKNKPINVPTAGAQAFPMDGLGRLGHNPPRGPSAGWWVLTTANAAGTNGLTCLPKHGGARDSKFLVAHPMTDHCESCSTSTTAAERANHWRHRAPRNMNVRFSSDPPKVHVMRVWAFAARQARAGHWERCALDRDRFKRRIADVDMAVSWVLQPRHRSRVMFQRFMPWWNAQKRKELAEKKAREEEEKVKKEQEEKARIEAEEKREENQVHGNDLVNDCVRVNDNDCVHINDNHVAVNDEGQKHDDVSMNDGVKIVNDDTDKIENKLNNITINGFVDKAHVNNKSLLNDDSTKNGLINDKQNDFTSKLRSGGLSNT
ncbi:hypothetical protein evm_002301 [Chilo suppressalis]|nr:hypothetical protein evm_002301 [Chilo suppressalis]